MHTSNTAIYCGSDGYFFYNSRTAFHLACFKVDSEIINHLYSLGVNINVQDADGATPMHKVENQYDYFYLSHSIL